MVLAPTIKKVAPASLPVASANYDFFDIAEGTGIENYFLSQRISSGATGSFLTSDEATYSGKVVEKFDTANSWRIRSDLDYDVTFNLPKIIKGKIRLSLTQGVSGDANLRNISLVDQMIKVSGGVETPFGDAMQTAELSSSLSETKSLTVNVTTDTNGRVHFKAGDTLRCNVKFWGQIGAGTQIGYGVDPQDRNDSTVDGIQTVIKDVDTTQAKLSVPFIIDI